MSFSPHDLLPAPEPSTVCYPEGYFYKNVAQPLIADTVRIMDNGLNLDMEKVAQLETSLKEILAQVEVNLANNPLIQDYVKQKHKIVTKEYKEDRKSKMRSKQYYLDKMPEFKHSDMNHRSYFMHIYCQQRNLPEPSELLPTGVPKWPAKLVSRMKSDHPLLARLLDKTLPTSHSIAQKALSKLAEDKAEMYNAVYKMQIENPVVDLPAFNPGSSKQKQELFEMLGIESEKTSKTTGLPSFDRDEIERIHKSTTDEFIKSLTQQMIDHSFAAIVKNNFIEAFYKYSVNRRLYGNLKLLGAKSARYTSNKPNLLNMPSTGSIFAKPIKRCFTAPEGWLIATADYAALEDRVVANLSRDTNKLAVFTDGLDGHSLAATYYYKQRVEALIGPYTDHSKAAKELKELVDQNNSKAESVRQDSKPVSFGLAYGAFPKKVAATVKIPIEDAEVIFNAYHNELFPGITKFREEYVLPTAQADGRIHLGLGFYIYTDNPENDIRTINNACSQFWSILTAITINKMHQLIDEAGLQDDILITSTIYDSIYFEVRDNPELVQWLNNNLIPVMEQDFMVNQIVHNSVDLEVGTSWANLITLPHNASTEEISELVQKVKEKENE